MEGKDGRTEKATPRKRSKARKDGQLARSQEVSTVVVMILGLMGISWGIPHIGNYLKALNEMMLQFHVRETWTVPLMQHMFFGLCKVACMMTLPIIVPVVIGAIIASLVQTKPYWSLKPLQWKLSGLSPIRGAKQLFSSQSLMTFALSMVKVALVSSILYLVLKSKIPQLISLQYMEVRSSAIFVFQVIMKMAWWVTVLAIIIAVVDWIFQQRKYEKSLMMTKEEVKEERKSSEQNPIIKRAQAKKMREMSMLRMMAAIPDATMVITNPTHVAVAIKYDPDMDAPQVVAKGLRLVAERIKRIARENDIPIIEKPPLARALYKEVKPGRSVPSQYYAAVAELIAYLYRIGNDHVKQVLSKTKKSA
ncbi:MAG: EscU/YscU/HrcU family type III secretion system export apparatus switch protein [Spartobacteria bacterium]|nr:EscU/YscU/HrcU family type III secretion system export apparatus switch protein [Spartobacteria bacterium]